MPVVYVLWIIHALVVRTFPVVAACSCYYHGYLRISCQLVHNNNNSCHEAQDINAMRPPTTAQSAKLYFNPEKRYQVLYFTGPLRYDNSY